MVGSARRTAAAPSSARAASRGRPRCHKSRPRSASSSARPGVPRPRSSARPASVARPASGPSRAPRICASRLRPAKGFKASDAVKDGTGADAVYLANSLAQPKAATDLYVGLLPYALVQGGLIPSAMVSVIDGAGEPVPGAPVVGTLYSPGKVEWLQCTTDAGGGCTLRGSPSAASVWAFRVDAIERDGVGVHPSRAIWDSDGLEVLLTALEAQPTPWDAVAIYWPGGTDPRLGSTAEAWAVVDTGAGLLSSPTGVLFKASGVSATPGTVTLDIDGTGLLSSPYGTLTLNTLTFSGSGLVSSPFGSSLTLVGLNGSGLLSSPIGFHATDLCGSGLMSSPTGSYGIKLDSGTMIGASLAGTAIEALVVDGSTSTGYSPTSALIGSGSVSTSLASLGSSSAPASASSAVEWKP
jgi:hypothetical protein